MRNQEGGGTESALPWVSNPREGQRVAVLQNPVQIAVPGIVLKDGGTPEVVHAVKARSPQTPEDIT